MIIICYFYKNNFMNSIIWRLYTIICDLYMHELSFLDNEYFPFLTKSSFIIQVNNYKSNKAKDLQYFGTKKTSIIKKGNESKKKI